MSKISRVNLDKVGAFASAVCAVHCLLTGAAIGLLSVLGLGFLGSPGAEAAFIVVTVTVGTIAVVHGRRKHHSIIPALIFVTGLVCWLISHFVFGDGDKQPLQHAHGPFGTLFSVLGGICLVLFHAVNLRMQHKCDCCHCQTGQ